ncbi:PepSY-associated TM helix domain-containing protein [Pedobacter frigoris]|uniref:PepSY-associated TM helix domain-containing protein n=1 Tax=Pedobacter frigoris TaxID=2571272 RepID=UPI00292CFE2B|nr:PepSY-associated TM helix domain-containing protein [Pedobacter frigoris]
MSLKLKRAWKWAKHQKRWFGKWHTYLGIIAGAILAFVGVTGSILVFQDEIDRALNKELFEVMAQQKKLSFDELVPLVKKNYPRLKFDYMMAGKGDSPAEAYSIFNFKTEEQYFINPYNGKLSGKRIISSSFIRVVMDLHRTLLIPAAGRYIVGFASLCLMILTISGVRLWLPKKWKQLKSVLTVKFNGKFKRQNYDWHNVLGFYSSPVVFMLSLTGFCITFSTLVIPLLFVFSGKNPAGLQQVFGAKSAYQKNVVQMPMKEIIERVSQQMPDARIGGLALPADKFGVYRFDMVSGNLPREGKREMISVDQYTGKILLNSRRDFPNVGDAYLSWLTPIHYGSFGGLPTQILALIGGLIPLFLFITGFIIWWPRFKKQREKNAKPKEGLTNVPKKEKEVKEKIRLWAYFKTNLTSGFKYAAIVWPLTAVAGGIYGLISGIVIQPAVFAIAFTCVLVSLNFVCALLAEIFNLLFLLPFKKGSLKITRYFSLSLSFFVVFIIGYILVLNTGLKVF